MTAEKRLKERSKVAPENAYRMVARKGSGCANGVFDLEMTEYSSKIVSSCRIRCKSKTNLNGRCIVWHGD